MPLSNGDPSPKPSVSSALSDLPYSKWLERVSPEFRWDWPHLAYLRKSLAEVTIGDLNRLIINLPPQHGKSEGLTVRYPVWRLTRDPRLRVAVGAYNQTHANRFSRKSRKIIKGLIPLSAERKAVNEWETDAGGSYVAVGAGAGITGLPVDMLLIDDPVKSREEADSLAHQERVWEWYMDDLTTRLQQNAPVILVMTRWNEADLTGKILASDDGPNWRHISLPAIAEEHDPLGRREGAPLCPQLHDLADLEGKRRVMGEGFDGLYQQRPVPRGGLFFRRDWFDIVDGVPDDQVEQRLRYWDLAATVKKTSAYTSGVLVAKTGKYWYIEDVYRGRWIPAERNDVILRTSQADVQRPKFRKTWFEKQPAGAGVEVSEALIRKLAGMPVQEDPITGSKEDRAVPFADLARQGLVKIVRAPWNDAFLTELASFPRGTYKDQIDSASGCINKSTVVQNELFFSTSQPSAGQVTLAAMQHVRDHPPSAADNNDHAELRKMLAENPDGFNARLNVLERDSRPKPVKRMVTSYAQRRIDEAWD